MPCQCGHRPKSKAEFGTKIWWRRYHQLPVLSTVRCGVSRPSGSRDCPASGWVLPTNYVVHRNEARNRIFLNYELPIPNHFFRQYFEPIADLRKKTSPPLVLPMPYVLDAFIMIDKTLGKSSWKSSRQQPHPSSVKLKLLHLPDRHITVQLYRRNDASLVKPRVCAEFLAFDNL
jgi:hypothetical protein